MAWSKELEKSYADQRKIRYYMIDCVVCTSPIIPKERDENDGMCNHCYKEKVKKGGCIGEREMGNWDGIRLEMRKRIQDIM